MPVRRISIFGAPGAGKTVLAHELFAHFKKAGRICEVVNELAREWAYVDRPIQSMDQLYLFSTQLHREDTLLTRNKGEFIITDSPVLLNAFYGTLVSPELLPAYVQFSQSFDARYRSINFFCPLNSKFAYHNEGRYHSQEESRLLSDRIQAFLNNILGGNLIVLSSENRLQEALNALQPELCAGYLKLE